MAVSPRGTAPARSLAAGVYEHEPSDVPRIAGLPAWNDVNVQNGDTWLNDTTAGRLMSYRQTVDMYDGVVRTSYDWVDGARRTSVQVESFVSRADPHLAAVRVIVVPHFSGRMRAAFSLRGWPPPARIAFARLDSLRPEWGNDRRWYPGHMTVVSRAASPAGSGALLRVLARPLGAPTSVAVAAAVTWPASLAGVVTRTATVTSMATALMTFDAAAEESYTFEKIVAVVPASRGDSTDRAVADVRSARAQGYDTLLARHVDAWHRLWETDIVVDGDTELQRFVRSALFYLLCSAAPGTAMGIPPMGLSSAGYYGHVFWDSDTWMFPGLLLAHPDVARSLVAFRERTLDAARRNARTNGYRGAMYPWEADELGNETTPRFAGQNAKYEIHVTGDVALAQWEYYAATGDQSWLAAHGEPVIRATADFWTSRASRDESGRYHIRHVVSVDEGLVGIDDDAYTNAIARRNLEIATAASRIVGRLPDTRWERIAAGLVVPYDSAGEYHPTYAGAPDSTRGSVVPLLSYPLGLPDPERAKRNDLDAAVRALMAQGAGAMMTVTLYPVIAAELGDRALVDSLLPLTWRQHVRPPFYVLAETPKGGPEAVNFMTGGGGFLQQVIFGYTGLRLTEEGVTRRYPPLLPSAIRRLTLKNFHLRGQRVDVIVEGDQLRMEPRP